MFQTGDQPGVFKCASCKHVLSFVTLRKYRAPSDPTRSAGVIYCITCTLCKKLYIGETRRRLGDRFREHLRDVEKDDKNASKQVARQFNLPNHSKQNIAVCGLSQHQGSTESRKTLEQKFIFQIGTLNPHGINETLFIQLIYSVVIHVTMHQPTAQLHLSVYKPHTTHNSSIRSDEGLTLKTSAFEVDKTKLSQKENTYNQRQNC